MLVKVSRVERHSKNIATIYINANLKPLPGQFAMVNVFGQEEIPISFSSESSFTVKAVGKTTRQLVEIEAGEIIGVRGPFGRPFRIRNHALLVAGGIGIAPLRFLYSFMKRLNYDVRIVYGAKNEEELIWKDFSNAIFATEDGSFGYKGTAVDLVEKENLDKYSAVYCCGKSEFLKRLYKIFKTVSDTKIVEFSLERFIRCGIGVCGSCVLPNGMRVCKDGPVFSLDEIDFDDL